MRQGRGGGRPRVGLPARLRRRDRLGRRLEDVRRRARRVRRRVRARRGRARRDTSMRNRRFTSLKSCLEENSRNRPTCVLTVGRSVGLAARGDPRLRRSAARAASSRWTSTQPSSPRRRRSARPTALTRPRTATSPCSKCSSRQGRGGVICDPLPPPSSSSSALVSGHDGTVAHQELIAAPSNTPVRVTTITAGSACCGRVVSLVVCARAS